MTLFTNQINDKFCSNRLFKPRTPSIFFRLFKNAITLLGKCVKVENASISLGRNPYVSHLLSSCLLFFIYPTGWVGGLSTTTAQKRTGKSLLTVMVDLYTSFPIEIAVTFQRPNIVIYELSLCAVLDCIVGGAGCCHLYSQNCPLRISHECPP